MINCRDWRGWPPPGSGHRPDASVDRLGASISTHAVTAALYDVPATGVGAMTSAYLRARDADPKSSYGDFAAVSHPVDDELAELLGGVVCDGVIACGTA